MHSAAHVQSNIVRTEVALLSCAPILRARIKTRDIRLGHAMDVDRVIDQTPITDITTRVAHVSLHIQHILHAHTHTDTNLSG